MTPNMTGVPELQAVSEDTTDIAAVLQSLMDTWNRHDMVAYAANFAENADFVNVLGERYTGREQIEAQHVRIHKTVMRNSQLWNTEYTVRKLTSEVAIAHVNWGMRGHEAPPEWHIPEIRKGVLTVVLVRESGKWQITAAQNTDSISVSFPK
jgi:uncharacterized protein (TIGR02246 family)